MPDFPIDPELRIRASPPVVLRRTTEAVRFCHRARSVSRRLDRSRAMLARAVRSGAARKARVCICSLQSFSRIHKPDRECRSRK
jgi:hypothetical protein